MRIKYAFCLLCLGALSLDVCAQYGVKTKKDSLCIPSIEGFARPKGLLIRQEVISNHRIYSQNTDGTKVDEAGRIRAVRQREIKLKAPVLNNPGLKVAVGFKYKVEDFFIKDIKRETNPFFHNIENKNLKQLGASVYLMKPFQGNTYFLLRASASLNGDFDSRNSLNADYLKISVAPLLGWKRSPTLTYAVGLAYSENFGRRSVFPLLSYNQTFNERIGIESLLPLNVKLRYSSLDKKNYLYLSSEVHGTSYNVSFRNGDNGYLNNTELKYQITYEREIYDFVWFSIETGINSNIDFLLSDTPDFKRSIVVDSNRGWSFYGGFSIFIVPPKKFYH